jgi:hypothetical protein
MDSRYTVCWRPTVWKDTSLTPNRCPSMHAPVDWRGIEREQVVLVRPRPPDRDLLQPDQQAAHPERSILSKCRGRTVPQRGWPRRMPSSPLSPDS